MIDQSNRAGKSNINDGEDLDGQNRLCLPAPICLPSTITKRQNHSRRTRGSAQIKRKSHRQTNSTKIPVTAAAAAVAVVSRRSPLSYMTKGKSV
jgi:hypothetical protein